jgi:hypothetical protein
MFGTRWLARGGGAALAVGIAFAAGSTWAQVALRPGGAGLPTLDARLARAVAARPQVNITAAVMDYSGPTTTAALHDPINNVLDLLVSQNVDATIGDFRPIGLLVLLGDPAAGGKMEVGVTVPGNARVSAPLKLETFRMARAIRHLHFGPYEQLLQTNNAAGTALKKATPQAKTGFPVVIQILDDPTRFQPNQLRAVVNIPIQ